MEEQEKEKIPVLIQEADPRNLAKLLDIVTEDTQRLVAPYVQDVSNNPEKHILSPHDVGIARLVLLSYQKENIR